MPYTLGTSGRVTLSVFDLRGREVMRVLTDARQPAGTHAATFDASALASGIYTYRLQVESEGGSVMRQLGG
ncbi:MAG: T9SS type A sorting domain-containing protein [Rhodothermaceae bacterium]|nr:T9SS type A sorting domain-containing protein [Rhodothermaceae bacterium]